MRAPWSSNYTVNINTEMNYWIAEKANLSDCHMPLLELIERTSKKGEKTAQDVYHLAGWVSHHNLDIWGHSSLSQLMLRACPEIHRKCTDLYLCLYPLLPINRIHFIIDDHMIASISAVFGM